MVPATSNTPTVRGRTKNMSPKAGVARPTPCEVDARATIALVDPTPTILPVTKEPTTGQAPGTIRALALGTPQGVAMIQRQTTRPTTRQAFVMSSGSRQAPLSAGNTGRRTAITQPPLDPEPRVQTTVPAPVRADVGRACHTALLPRRGSSKVATARPLAGPTTHASV